MEIRYQPNPLQTIVELDSHDLEILRLKLEIEELENRVYGAAYHLSSEHAACDPKKALAELRIDGLDDEPLKRRIDEKLEYHLADLRQHHMGDCTCVPCSCGKCHAESLLGIDTIAGLGKHEATKIEAAFGDGRTLDQAIAHLANYRPVNNHPSWKGVPQAEFDRHVPRWTLEAETALEWLRAYRLDHFPAT